MCNSELIKIVLWHFIYNHSKLYNMETTIETTVIERIITIKKNEGLTNEKMSIKANVSVETIKSMFSKKTNPNLDTIQKIYSAFPHYSLEWIICGSGDMYKKEDGAKFVEIVVGKNLTVQELRREYIRLKEVERSFNALNESRIDIAASPVPLYGNAYAVIEELKNSNIQYKKDVEWYKNELDKKQNMIDTLMSGDILIQKNVG